MKKFLATILLVLCISPSFAQSQYNNENGRYYCEIKCYENSIKSSSAVIFDFGDAVSLEIWGCKSHKLKFVDENGKKIKFKNIVDATHFLCERGWTLQEAYSSQYGEKKSIKHWILYKDVDGYDKLREGLVTKKEYKKMNK